MKLLLTGATGFVGRNLLLRSLKEKRYSEIWVTVRNEAKLKANFAADGFKAIPSEVKLLSTAGPAWDLSGLPPVDHVIHGAGVIFARNRNEYFKTHVDATIGLFQKLPPTSAVLVLSSQSASGPTFGALERRESDGDSPVTWYGESKLAMERALKAQFSDRNYLCLRPPMVFGPRDSTTLPLFKMVRGPIRFKPGFRPKWYSVIGVDDLVEAIFKALDRSGDWRRLDRRSYFVSGHNLSDRELIAGAARASDRRPGLTLSVPQPILRGVTWVIDAVPPWRAKLPSLTVDRAKEIWPDRWVISPGEFEQVFGWKANEDFLETLKSTHDWYVSSGLL